MRKSTPVVDGSGVKNTLERKTIEYLQENGIVDFTDKKVLMVCAVDRFGMAQSIAKLTKKVVFGDLMFSLGVPMPMKSYSAVRVVASILLPIVTRLPFQVVLSDRRKAGKDRAEVWAEYYEWADVIAGD